MTFRNFKTSVTFNHQRTLWTGWCSVGKTFFSNILKSCNAKGLKPRRILNIIPVSYYFYVVGLQKILWPLFAQLSQCSMVFKDSFLASRIIKKKTFWHLSRYFLLKLFSRSLILSFSIIYRCLRHLLLSTRSIFLSATLFFYLEHFLLLSFSIQLSLPASFAFNSHSQNFLFFLFFSVFLSHLQHYMVFFLFLSS